MKDLILAMAEEKAYVNDRKQGINTSFPDRIAAFGYDNITEYFQDKKEYIFNQWKPEVYDIHVSTLTTDLEAAVQSGKHGIYISVTEGLYAFHGAEPIDRNLCQELGICVAELYYNGGTIIGGPEDFGIEIVAPKWVGLDNNSALNKFHEIISKYIDGAEIHGNDILVDGKKVMGSMCRVVGDTFVWAAQVSFDDHSEIISQICSKKSGKVPGFIDGDKLSKETFKKEVLGWLRKQ